MLKLYISKISNYHDIKDNPKVIKETKKYIENFNGINKKTQKDFYNHESSKEEVDTQLNKAFSQIFQMFLEQEKIMEMFINLFQILYNLSIPLTKKMFPNILKTKIIEYLKENFSKENLEEYLLSNFNLKPEAFYENHSYALEDFGNKLLENRNLVSAGAILFLSDFMPQRILINEQTIDRLKFLFVE